MIEKRKESMERYSGKSFILSYATSSYVSYMFCVHEQLAHVL